MNKKKYMVKICYDGSLFFGWAKQINKITVQEEIEKTLSLIFQEKINIYGSGRTDKYVHALDQCFHFSIITPIPVNSIKKVFNQFINDGIYMKSIRIVSEKFHARFSIIKKVYLYKINTGKFNLFERNYVLQYCKAIDIKKIKTIFKYFLGEKDFLSFSTSIVNNTVRKITKISIFKKNNYVHIKIEGDGFLRNMVRMIIACFLNFNEAKIDIEEIKKLFINPQKGKAVNKVDGCGLYLYKTFY